MRLTTVKWTNEDFRAWLNRLGLNDVQAASLLGATRKTIASYRTGKTAIPIYIARACRDIERDFDYQ